MIGSNYLEKGGVILGTALLLKVSNTKSITIHKEENQYNSRFWYEIQEKNEIIEQGKIVDRFSNIIKQLKNKIPTFHKLEIIDGDQKLVKEIMDAQLGDHTHYNSQERLLDLCNRLLKGEEISIEKEAITYGVHEATIKKSIYLIRNFLEEFDIHLKNGMYKIRKSELLSYSETILLLLNIYQSNSFSYKEIKSLEKKLVQQLSDEAQLQLSKLFHDFDICCKETNVKDLLPNVEVIFRAIDERKGLSFIYKSDNASLKVRLLKPHSIHFHEGSYYLIGEMLEGVNKGKRNFKLEHIQNLRISRKSIMIDEIENPQSTEIFIPSSKRKEMVTLKIQSVLMESLLRDFPNSKQIKVENAWATYEIEVKDTDNILVWILSQKEVVEIIGPEDFRNQMKTHLQNLLNVYNEGA